MSLLNHPALGVHCYSKRYFAAKKILVTGASSGIGKACAIWLLNQGAMVVLVGKDLPKLDAIGEQFPNQATCIRCDLSEEEAVREMVNCALESLGGLNILINCVGVIHENELNSAYLAENDYMLDLNLRSVYLVSRLTADALAKHAGCIVNLSCGWGNRPAQGLLSHCISKAGVEMLTKCLAVELSPTRVNAVAPGFTHSAYFASAGLSAVKIRKAEVAMSAANPMKRNCFPEEAARAILFFCGKHSNSITGQVFRVDGGQGLTSSITSNWSHSYFMNAKFAATRDNPLVKPIAHFTATAGIVVEAKIEPDQEWINENEKRSNWGTNSADAHVKVTDYYNKLKGPEHVIAGLEELKDEDGTIFTKENPKPARFVGGGSAKESMVSFSLSPLGRSEYRE